MRTLLAFLLLFASAIAGAQDALPVREVDEYLTRMEAFGVSGVVVIMDRGKIVLEKGYGLADRARNIPMTPDTLFDIGSITKTYTGTAILQLVDAGKLTLDDTLPKFFKDVPEEKRGITIRQLMTHTAGLPLYSGGDFDLATREQMVKATLEPKLRFEPGSKWEYCNTCYQLLTVVIEDVSGKPYEKYIHDHLLTPAGIRDTGYVIPDYLGRPTAIAYRGSVVDGSPLEKPWYGDGPSWNLRGAGGFMAPLRDLAKWDRALRALPESIRYRHLEPVLATGRATNDKMTYGWFSRDTPAGRLIMHSGGNGFFAVNLRRYVDRDLVVIFGTNNSRYDWVPTEGEIAARLLGTSKAAMPPAAKISSASLLKHAGRYKLPAGEEFELRVDRGQLVVNGSTALYPLLGRHAKALDTPRAREVEALAREVTTAVGRKDFSLLTKSLPPDVDPAGEAEFYANWMKEREERWGAFVSATPLWTIAEGDDLHAYMLMKFARGGEILAFQQRAKGIYLHVPSRPVLPEVYRFVAQSEQELVTWNPYLEAATTMRVEPNAVVIGGTRAVRVP